MPEAEVDQAFNNMASASTSPAQQFTQVLERAGIAPNTLKARIRAELTWTQLVRGKFGASLEVGEAEVANALRARNDNEADAVGYIYTLYPVMVLVPPGSSAAVVDAKRREAENLRSALRHLQGGPGLCRARCATSRCASRSRAARPISRRNCASCSTTCRSAT